MKVFLGLTENSSPNDARMFGLFGERLVDLQSVQARRLCESGIDVEVAADQASFDFPSMIGALLTQGDSSRQRLDDLSEYINRVGLRNLCGPANEKAVYGVNEIKILPPLQNPEKSFTIGFADKARIEAMPPAEIPTGFYKLPQTFVTNGAPIVLPKFSEEVDADACLAIVIGKAGRRIAPEKAWDYVAGVTLVIDVTARDVNRREGATTNNLLGKNFPSSTAIGPAVLLTHSRREIEALEVDLSLNGAIQQKFTLRDCVFSVEQIIARWSILGIKPGDWLGVGASMAKQGDRLQNPVLLKPGVKIRCSSPQIGELNHEVIAAGGARR
ncbi:MAG: fumarylacetoacetate hydrolase family protein [Deltaproteobacteria bacterium]|nr:fumarylacetoacetate hydrolase family protein [Deltaproteobacteria bacterium]MBM4299344.1 fumarylacetoacetate hydrolase family protein [Deltaproteobacteria bacterium]